MIGFQRSLYGVGAASFLVALIIIFPVFAAELSVQTTPTTVESGASNVALTFNVSNDNISANITHVNISVPSGFLYLSGSNGTTATESTFSNNSVNLSWANGTVSALIGGGGAENFSFNVSVPSGVGTYDFNVTIVDNESVLNVTQSTITVADTIGPDVTILTPANISYATSAINFTAFMNDLNPDTGFLQLTFSGLATNYTMTNDSGTWSYTNNTMADGVYIAEYFFNDSGGNVNFSEQVTFTIVSCGSTLTADLTLTQDISSPGSCLTIGADDLVIDGAGFSMTGITGAGTGIDNTGEYDNITIRNFNAIDNFTFGIHAQGMENATIVNNSIFAAPLTTARAILIGPGSDTNNISRNNVTTFESNSHAIYINGSTNQTITYNNVTTNSTTAIGIAIVNASTWNTISYNVVNTSTTYSDGVSLTTQSAFNTISFNTIRVLSGDDDTAGIITNNASSNTFTSNTVTIWGTTGRGIYVPAADNTTVTGNNVTTYGNGGEGILVESSDNVTITGNVITIYNTTVAISLDGVTNVRSSWNNVTVNISGGFSYTLSNTNATNASNDRFDGSATTDINVPANANNSTFTHLFIRNETNLTSQGVRSVNIGVNTSPPDGPSSLLNLSDFLNINNVTSGSWFIFNLSYQTEELSGVDEPTIKLYHYDLSTATWSAISSSSFDTANNVLQSSNLSNPTGLYAAFGSAPSSSDGSGSSGGGGGGGGAAPARTKESKVWTNIDANETAVMDIDHANISLREISFVMTKEKNSIQVTVESFGTVRDDDLPAPPGLVYQYLEIDIDNFEEDDYQEGVELAFIVNNSWVENNDIEIVEIYRYTDQWDLLETTHSHNDANSHHYEATTPGFSFFVIVGHEEAAVTCGDGICNGDETTESCPGDCPPAAQPCTPGEMRCDGNQLQECTTDGSAFETTQVCQYGCSDQSCITPSIDTPAVTIKGPNQWVYAIPILIIIVIIIVFYLVKANALTKQKKGYIYKPHKPKRFKKRY